MMDRAIKSDLATLRLDLSFDFLPLARTDRAVAGSRVPVMCPVCDSVAFPQMLRYVSSASADKPPSRTDYPCRACLEVKAEILVHKLNGDFRWECYC
jgi:hypothetical protein